MDQVNVLLASSRMGLRLCLRQVLENEGWIKVVGMPASEDDALLLTRELAPHVIILDSDLAVDSVEAGRRILKTNSAAKIILLGSPSLEGPAAVESIEWLSKDSNPAELMQSIAKINRWRPIH